jgi:hypothetical protein
LSLIIFDGAFFLNVEPADKIILSIPYKMEKLGLMIHNTRFGKTAIISVNEFLNPEDIFLPGS